MKGDFVMKQTVKLIVSVVEIVIGAGLIVANLLGWLDEFWSGMGSGLLVVGVLFLIRHIRYRTNDTYRKAVDTELDDERNRFLSTKAWSWAGYLFVLIAAVASIVFRIIGMEEYVPFASGSVCLLIVLYWVSYMILKRKY